MKQTFDYFRADPAGNITGFVVWPVYPGYRKAYTKAIMEQIDSEVEQVGFISPSYDGYPLRMDMMGGEFCANATRAYGLYASQYIEEEGDIEVEVYVSGSKKPLTVIANTANSTASIELPPAKNLDKLQIETSTYMIVELEGITHMIVDDREENEKFVKKALDLLKEKFDAEAYGIMFLDTDKHKLSPYVYVKGSDTLVKEGSCGSGTVACAYYLNKNKTDSFREELKQPRGTLEIIARKDNNMIKYSIGGKIDIGEKKKVTIDIPAEEVKKIKEEYKKQNSKTEE